MSTLKLDRTHRFAVGDLVCHIDAPSDAMEIDDLTIRVHNGVAYPTYTLTGMGETVEDVLCTLDLALVRENV